MYIYREREFLCVCLCVCVCVQKASADKSDFYQFISNFAVNTFIFTIKVDEKWNHRWNAPERYKNPDEVELFPIGDGLLMFIKSNVFCNVCG